MITGSPHQIAIKSFFSLFGIYPARSIKYQELLRSQLKLQQFTRWWELLKTIPEEKAAYFAKHLEFSSSQFFQDLFVASELGDPQGGFFVEVGACDGFRLSNSLFFERHRNWSGILAEPGRSWHSALRSNRKARIDTRALWHTTGLKLLFNEAEAKEVATLDQFTGGDFHSSLRQGGQRYEVETISLDDLLESHAAPAVVDYLSIDTEGSEFEILSHFSFQKRKVRCITCEHNFTPNREKIFKLLSAQGYTRKYVEFSDCDDWYFLSGPCSGQGSSQRAKNSKPL